MAFTNNARSISVVKADKFEEYASLFLWDYDYIFYVSPKGVNIENNGVRETDAEYRDQIDNTIKQLLKKYKKNIKNLIKLEGSTEKRVKKVINEIGDNISLNNQTLSHIYK